jgi:hypothetical protein
VGRPLERKHLPEFAEDVRNLKDRNLQRRVLTIWTDVSKGTLVGVPLADLHAVGDLSDCFKVYFDTEEVGPPRYRFVYRLLPNEVQAVSVEAVAVGERKALRVYVEAARRLGRLNEPD